MARTTVAEVRQILVTTIEDADIQAYINVANRIVTAILSTSLSDARKADIEMFLAAHMIASTRDRMVQSEKLGDASVTYSGTFGAYLDSTTYGQNVKILDTTGQMANTGKKLAGLWTIVEDYTE